jgi:hypothetical protein
MKHLLVILADVNAVDLKQQFSNSRLYQTLIIFGAITAAAVIGVIWAILYSQRKKHRKHRHHHHYEHHPEEPASQNDNQSDEKGEGSSRRKWRRHRREHRPMNPTLAQTGGLPPLRDENSPPSAMP